MALGTSGAESNSTGNSDGKPKGKKRSLGEMASLCQNGRIVR